MSTAAGKALGNRAVTAADAQASHGKMADEMKAQWWLTGVVGAIALGATGCSLGPDPMQHTQPTRPDDHAALTGASRVHVRITNGTDPAQAPVRVTPAASQHAVAAAIRIVKSAILPGGSRAIAQLPGKNLSEPAQVSACDPIVDATTLWLISGSASKLTAFLVHHVPPGMTNQETGSSTSGGVTTSDSVADVPRGKHPPQETLIFTFGPAGRANTIGLRVDALTVPSGALCMSS
jgi:hypothetical protein